MVQTSRHVVGFRDVGHTNVRIAEKFVMKAETGDMTMNINVRENSKNFKSSDARWIAVK